MNGEENNVCCLMQKINNYILEYNKLKIAYIQIKMENAYGVHILIISNKKIKRMWFLMVIKMPILFKILDLFKRVSNIICQMEYVVQQAITIKVKNVLNLQ